MDEIANLNDVVEVSYTLDELVQKFIFLVLRLKCFMKNNIYCIIDLFSNNALSYMTRSFCLHVRF